MADVMIAPGFSGYSRLAFAYSMKPTLFMMENFEVGARCIPSMQQQ